MAWIFKNPADALEFFDAAAAGGETWYSWVVDHLPSLLPSPLNALDFQQPQNGADPQIGAAGPDAPAAGPDAPAAVQIAAPTLAIGVSQPAVAGTPGADVFPLDYAALLAAVAPLPTVAQISGYSAAQGDVVDVSAILRGSYAPLTADNAQVRVSEDASAAFATVDFNVGTAANPHWVALAKLDGVQAGDAVNVVLDATHTVALHAALLA
jgi:hypothetical protein